MTELTGQYYFETREIQFEYLHKRLNELIGELKRLSIGLSVNDVRYIKNLKSELWTNCSNGYQQDFIQNHQSYMY